MFGGADENAPGLRFSLFGFPVTVGWSFFLIPAIFTFGSGAPLSFTALWVVIVGVSVLVHELGHAFAARRLGSEPRISLYSLGGLTSYRPIRAHSRSEAIGVSFAGPAAGFGLGLAVLALDRWFDPAGGSTAHDAVRLATFANLGWGFVNLVPVLPLDGGNIMANLLPGDHERRYTTAARVSLAVAAVVGGLALWQGYTFVAVLFGFCAFSNFDLARTAPHGAGDTLQTSLSRLRSGQVEALDDVRRELARVPSGARRASLATAAADMALSLGALDEVDAFAAAFDRQLDDAVVAELAFRRGDTSTLKVLYRHVAASPDPFAARCLTRALVSAGRAGELIPFVRDGPEELGRLAVLREMHLLVHVGGDAPVAAELGQMVLERYPDAEAATWYNVACSLSRSGHVDRALQVLSGAIDRGWNQLDQLDRDPDLAAARAHPAFPSVRYRVSSRPA